MITTFFRFVNRHTKQYVNFMAFRAAVASILDRTDRGPDCAARDDVVVDGHQM